MECKVISIQVKKEYIEYLEYNTIIITIPNLELHKITKQSILNFQHRLFYELRYLLLDPLIRIEKNNSYYSYNCRIYDSYAFNNINKLEPLLNTLFNTFPFILINKKRISSFDSINTNIKKLKI